MPVEVAIRLTPAGFLLREILVPLCRVQSWNVRVLQRAPPRLHVARLLVAFRPLIRQTDNR